MIKTILFFIYLTTLLSSAVLAIVFRRGIKKRKLSILVPYLSLVFLLEAGVYIATTNKLIASPVFIYNIYKIVTVIVFALLYYRVPFMAPSRKLLLALTAVYLLAALVMYVFFLSIFSLDTYLTLLRGLVITCFAVLFLLRFFHLDDRKEEQFWRPLIWITAGIAAFYPVISITSSFSLYLYQHDATLFGLKLYQSIPQLMSIFMYGCFSYAFYLCRKKN